MSSTNLYQQMKDFDLTTNPILTAIYELEASQAGDFILEYLETLGKDGALLNNVMYPAIKTEVFDVCGAGDAFLCGLVHCYLKTGDLEESMWFANRCGAVAVGHFGTYAITLEDTNANVC